MLGQTVDRKRADGAAVAASTVLGKAIQAAIRDEHTASWSRPSLIVDNNWACTMFAPGPHKVFGDEERKRVMTSWGGTGKHPPMVAEPKRRRIRQTPRQKVGDVDPAPWKRLSPIKANRPCAERLRDHEDRASMLEDVRI